MCETSITDVISGENQPNVIENWIVSKFTLITNKYLNIYETLATWDLNSRWLIFHL